jgi:hypothetical protein
VLYKKKAIVKQHKKKSPHTQNKQTNEMKKVQRMAFLRNENALV